MTLFILLRLKQSKRWCFLNLVKVILDKTVKCIMGMGGFHIDFYELILFYRVLNELSDIFSRLKKFKVIFEIWVIKVGDLNRFNNDDIFLSRWKQSKPCKINTLQNGQVYQVFIFHNVITISIIDKLIKYV